MAGTIAKEIEELIKIISKLPGDIKLPGNCFSNF